MLREHVIIPVTGKKESLQNHLRRLRFSRFIVSHEKARKEYLFEVSTTKNSVRIEQRSVRRNDTHCAEG